MNIHGNCSEMPTVHSAAGRTVIAASRSRFPQFAIFDDPVAQLPFERSVLIAEAVGRFW
jgi:hypothetical protein